MKTTISWLTLLFVVISCVQKNPEAEKDESGKTPADYVNPFIGTQDMGHCFPGAVAPHGMVQLSPDTDTIPYSTGDGYIPEVYRYCSGYQYNDPTIVGFSHTHLHGTGHSDLGDFLVMPFSDSVQLNPGTAENPESGYRSRYSKNTEKAGPGYYSVYLDDVKVKAELTCTKRVGFHRYTFDNQTDAGIILDLVHGIYNYPGKVIWASVRVENDTLVTGYRQTNGWARNRFIYFAMSFSKPVQSYGLINEETEIYRGFWRRWKMDNGFPERSGKKIKGWFSFGDHLQEPVMVKMALSSVSTEGAVKNLNVEIPGWDFEEIRKQTEDEWNAQLGRYKIKADPEQKTIFYTAVYHSLQNPSVYMDVDHHYRGLDGNIHRADFTNYTVFSLWDTFRALHPLMNIFSPKASNDMLRSMLAHYDQSVHPLLPVWSHHANDNWCMIGYHAVPVIADAWIKGIHGFDGNKALEAMVSSATYASYDGLADYMNLGYVPTEVSGSSASVTLEYAYDDYTIYKMAESLKKKDIAEHFYKRSRNFENLYDSKTCFMRAKSRTGSFLEPFDALSTHGMGYIEGNAWTYSLFVPHNIQKLMEMKGGNDAFVLHLDSLFEMHLPSEYYEHTEDIEAVSIMGNYVHGNEPGHHIPYLYTYAGKPWKTEQRIQQIMTGMYKNSPSGLCGNDDCGQMSAWYIFTAMGFYPVCPGTDYYIIGAPSFPYLTLQLENGNKVEITAENISTLNIYVKEIYLNGKKWENIYVKHSDLMKGCQIKFIMGSEPNQDRKSGYPEGDY